MEQAMKNFGLLTAQLISRMADITGLEPRELKSLRLADIDWGSCTLNFLEMGSEERQRIPIPLEVRDALYRFAQLRAAAGAPASAESPLFWNPPTSTFDTEFVPDAMAGPYARENISVEDLLPAGPMNETPTERALEAPAVATPTAPPSPRGVISEKPGPDMLGGFGSNPLPLDERSLLPEIDYDVEGGPRIGLEANPVGGIGPDL